MLKCHYKCLQIVYHLHKDLIQVILLPIVNLINYSIHCNTREGFECYHRMQWEAVMISMHTNTQMFDNTFCSCLGRLFTSRIKSFILIKIMRGKNFPKACVMALVLHPICSLLFIVVLLFKNLFIIFCL